MKKLVLYFIFAHVLFSSCLKEVRKKDFEEDSISGTLRVGVMPPDGKNLSLKGMEVRFFDNATGMVYSGTTDASGMVSIKVSYGSYTAVTETKIKKPGILEIYNGTSGKINVTPMNPSPEPSEILLNYSRTSQLIIKELYYGGCWNDQQNKAYLGKDAYFTIYNNSEETTYLDSICVGVVNPLNAPSFGQVSPWIKKGTTELRDSIPCGSIVWMFRGKGSDLPLEPGKEVICCINAINHTAGVQNSVDLGKPGYYALYAAGITTTQSAPTAGVHTLEMLWRAGSTAGFPISTMSPGLLLFNLGGKTPEKYIRDNYSPNPATPNSRPTDCLLVDKNLVLDGVECFRLPTDFKRFRPEVDNGFAMTPGSGKGYSLHRKIDIETTQPGKPVRYMDTNNSSTDFQVLPFATLTGKNTSAL